MLLIALLPTHLISKCNMKNLAHLSSGDGGGAPQLLPPRTKMNHRALKSSAAVFDSLEEFLWEQLGFSIHSWVRKRWDTFRARRQQGAANLRASLEQLRADATIARQAWYDFGHGYFYQSWPGQCVSGRRDTTKRIVELKLRSRVEGRRVLDIGSNVSFLDFLIADAAKKIVCVEPDPVASAIALVAANLSKSDNVEILPIPFEHFSDDSKFDVILSLSSHYSYQGAICGHFDTYLGRCEAMLSDEGMLILETNTPKFEARFGGVENTLDLLRRRFDVVEIQSYSSAVAIERGRRVVVAKKRGS
tara:strand:+ start:1280 stop:2191 length:912 start_codon:yes stop_codon:yes gene_type:complete